MSSGSRQSMYKYIKEMFKQPHDWITSVRIYNKHDYYKTFTPKQDEKKDDKRARSGSSVLINCEYTYISLFHKWEIDVHLPSRVPYFTASSQEVQQEKRKPLPASIPS